MIEAIQITREFRYQGILLSDLGENFTPEYIKDFYAGTYPALTNAEIQDKGISDDKHVYELCTKVATKGWRRSAINKLSEKKINQKRKKSNKPNGDSINISPPWYTKLGDRPVTNGYYFPRTVRTSYPEISRTSPHHGGWSDGLPEWTIR